MFKEIFAEGYEVLHESDSQQSVHSVTKKKRSREKRRDKKFENLQRRNEVIEGCLQEIIKRLFKENFEEVWTESIIKQS